MKEVQFTQSYELTITVNVEVADDWTQDDVEQAFTDFPISVDVNDLYEQINGHWFHNADLMGEEGEPMPNIIGLSVDCLVSRNALDQVVMETK